MVRDPALLEQLGETLRFLDGDRAHQDRLPLAVPLRLPIITVAEDAKSLRVLPKSAAAPKPQVAWEKEDWTRWNDYGIGLFLQGDLKGAERAFAKITEMDPQNPDGWTNVGRVRVQ